MNLYKIFKPELEPSVQVTKLNKRSPYMRFQIKMACLPYSILITSQLPSVLIDNKHDYYVL